MEEKQEHGIPATYLGMDHDGDMLEDGEERKWLLLNAASLSNAVRFAERRCGDNDPYIRDTKTKLDTFAKTLHDFSERNVQEHVTLVSPSDGSPAAPVPECCKHCRFYGRGSVGRIVLDAMADGGYRSRVVVGDVCRRREQYVEHSPDDWCGEFSHV